MEDLKRVIEKAWEEREHLQRDTASREVLEAVATCIEELDRGRLRVAEKVQGNWVVHEWLKKAVLLSFRFQDSRLLSGGCTQFYDKVPLKYARYNEMDFRREGIRVVPYAVVRKGAYVAPGTVLMPCFVNIGAYVDAGTMVDTWATVGSCAQIGRNVHLSGGVGIGGVLEPLQARPVIIEDGVFVGARSEIAEGVIVGEGAVIAMGVYIGASTKIYNRLTGEIHTGYVPPYSVVVPGTLPSSDGRYGLYAAIIVKQVDARTRARTSLNELLRE